MRSTRGLKVTVVLCFMIISCTSAFIFGHKPDVCPEQVKVTMACYNDCGWVPKCVKAERHPNPNDCGRYADCIPSGSEGEFTVREGDCFGNPFCPTLLRCVSKEEYTDCDTGVPRGGGVRQTHLDNLCSENNTSICLNCQQSVTCIGKEAYGEVCNMASFCSQEKSFGGSVCLPYAETRDMTNNCQCQPGKTVDTYNSTYYLTCQQVDNNTLLEVHSCPSGSEFNETDQMCSTDHSFCDEEPPVPNCAERGTFVNPDDCSWSYTCNGVGSSTLESTECCGSPNSFYHEFEGKCVQACQVLNPPPFLCPGIGSKPDPLDCRSYYICITDGGEPVNHLTCPEETHFDADLHTCVAGKCLPRHDYMTCPRAVDIEGTC